MSETEKLEQCQALLADLATSHRPIAGGFKPRAFALLVEQGVLSDPNTEDQPEGADSE